jgi:hypothetical protein
MSRHCSTKRYEESTQKSDMKRPKPLCLYPLKPEEALAAFMRVDPGKVKRMGSRALPKA